MLIVGGADIAVAVVVEPGAVGGLGGGCADGSIDGVEVSAIHIGIAVGVAEEAMEGDGLVAGGQGLGEGVEDGGGGKVQVEDSVGKGIGEDALAGEGEDPGEAVGGGVGGDDGESSAARLVRLIAAAGSARGDEGECEAGAAERRSAPSLIWMPVRLGGGAAVVTMWTSLMAAVLLEGAKPSRSKTSVAALRRGGSGCRG